MKARCIVLSCLLMATPALADGMPPTGPATAETTSQATEPARVAKTGLTPGRAKSLPRGDLRHCLELKDNMAIIRCAETRPSR